MNTSPGSQDVAAARVSSAQTSVNRRSLAKGVAWSVPALAVAAAAPAAAVSGTPPTFQFLDACKSPGNSCKVFPKGYDFRFNVCNPSSEDLWLWSVTYTVVGTNLTLIHALPPLPALVPASGCITMVFRADSSNSANQTFTATMNIPWGHTPVINGDPKNHPPLAIPFAVTETEPDCDCTATPTP